MDRSRHARVDVRARRPARGGVDAAPARTSREQDAAGAPDQRSWRRTRRSSTAPRESTTRRGPRRQTPPRSPRDRSRQARVDARARRPARGGADAGPARTSREQDAAGARRIGAHGGAREGARPRTRSRQPGEPQERRRHRAHRGIGAARRGLTRASAGRPEVASTLPPPVPLVNKTRRARAGSECMAAHATRLDRVHGVDDQGRPRKVDATALTGGPEPPGAG